MNGITALRTAAALGATMVILAACGGGGGGGSLPQLPGGGSAPPGKTPTPQPTTAAQTATATFSIAVPRNLSSAVRDVRHPMYVSPNTHSVGIALTAINGKPASGAPTVAAIDYGKSGCTPANAGPLTCTVNVTVPGQSYDTIAFSTYSSSNGSGTPLSTSTITQTFAANQQTNVPLSLGGVVASIAMSPSVVHAVQGSGISSYLVSLTAKDASGAVILGTTAYQSPISILIQNDPNHAISTSESVITAPGTPMQVRYDASKVLSDGKIVASAGSLGSAALDVIPLTFSPNAVTAQMGTAAQQISVSEAGFTGQFTASVDLPHTATASVSSTGPGTATVNIVPAPLGGSAGTATVTISDGSRSGTLPVKVTLPSLPGITEYPAVSGFSGIAMTKATTGLVYITSNSNAIAEFDPSTASMNLYSLNSFGFGVPQGIATDNGGNVWVADNFFPGQMCEMAVPSHAMSCYSAGLSSSSQIYGVARGADGGIWFCDSGVPAIGRIDPVSHAITEYTMGLSGSAQPYGIVAGNDGNMYFSDVGSTAAFGSISTSTGAINEYTAGLAAYDPTTQLSSTPYFLTLGSDGNIWAADPAYVAIDEFNVSTHTTVQHTNGIQHFGNPWGITSAPNGDLWFTDAGFFAPAALGNVKVANAFIQEYVGFPATATFSINGAIFTSVHDMWFIDQEAHAMGHVSVP